MTGKPPLVDRLHRFFAAAGRGETRRVTIAYDRRDRPPWTVDVVAGRRTLHVRSGETLQAALTAALEALSAPVPPLRPDPRLSGLPAANRREIDAENRDDPL